MIQDFTRDTDVRGDRAVFIESKNFDKGGWKLLPKAKKKLAQEIQTDDDVFFRVIEDGQETSSHGWISCESGEVIQWG